MYKKINIYLTLVFSVLVSLTTYAQSLKPAAFYENMNTTADSQRVILDVTPDEFAQDKLHANAINLDVSSYDIGTRIPKLDKSKTYFVYCLSGSRSVEMQNILKQAGFKNVYNLEGGMLAWKTAGLPIIKKGANLDGMSVDEFTQLINSEKTVLIDFWAPWCGPCKKMSPIIDNIKTKYAKKKVKVEKINVDQNSVIVKHLAISSIPYMVIYKEGVKTWESFGTVEQSVIEKQLK